jgi:NADH:ubiquinone oxidoreductase subunit 2 (subunit N)
VLGNVLALSQREVKRILAYSSISQTGYVLLAFGIGLYSGQVAGIEAGLLHLMTHGAAKVLAFLALGALIYLLHLDSRITLDDLAGTARRYPLLAIALTTAAFSLAGVPAFAGFMSKWQIFAAGLALGQPLMMALVIFAALNSVLSLAYYLPLVNVLYRPAERLADLRLPLAMRLPIMFLSAAVLVLGLWPTLFAGLIQAAAAAVLAGFGG